MLLRLVFSDDSWSIGDRSGFLRDWLTGRRGGAVSQFLPSEVG